MGYIYLWALLAVLIYAIRILVAFIVSRKKTYG